MADDPYTKKDSGYVLSFNDCVDFMVPMKKQVNSLKNLITAKKSEYVAAEKNMTTGEKALFTAEFIRYQACLDTFIAQGF